ncbi:MAG: hypothetical protein IT371_30785 [Deltaproteobacteria bacterium]|nr:hypothetical protein [Deltaproteobacteria bacterium]
MDARIRTLQRAASMGDSEARQRLYWEAFRAGVFGPGVNVHPDQVDSTYGFRAALQGLAFLGDKDAAKVLAEAVREAAPLYRDETPRAKVPSKLTHDLLTFSFGSIGMVALSTELVRYILTWAEDLHVPRGHEMTAAVAAWEVVRTAERQIVLDVERLRAGDVERGAPMFGGIAGRILGRPPLVSEQHNLFRVGDRVSRDYDALVRREGNASFWRAIETSTTLASVLLDANAPRVVRLWDRVRRLVTDVNYYPSPAEVAQANRDLKAAARPPLVALMTQGYVPVP